MQQAGEVLLREQDGDILIATMNRPERMNALDDNLSAALNEAWLDFRDSPDLKVMIITGAGDRAFCSGVDLRRNDERARDMGAQTAQAILDADRSRGVRLSFNGNNFGLWKPVIAAINGWCLAAGCEMALACDLRIMEEHAQMGLPEVKRGMGAKTDNSQAIPLDQPEHRPGNGLDRRYSDGATGLRSWAGDRGGAQV